MEEPKQADHSVTMVIVALTAIVFVLDVLTPLGIAIWALYVLPLGFTRWSSVEHLVFIVAGACTALIILGYVYSPSGASVEVAMMNRMLGVLMVWITAFFLRPERMETGAMLFHNQFFLTPSTATIEPQLNPEDSD